MQNTSFTYAALACCNRWAIFELEEATPFKKVCVLTPVSIFYLSIFFCGMAEFFIVIVSDILTTPCKKTAFFQKTYDAIAAEKITCVMLYKTLREHMPSIDDF